MICQLHARRHRQRAAVQGVHAVGVDEARQVRRAADAADGHNLVGLNPSSTSAFCSAASTPKSPQPGTSRDRPCPSIRVSVDLLQRGVVLVVAMFVLRS